MDQAKSLSKNLLYAPLEAYFQNATGFAAIPEKLNRASKSEPVPPSPSEYMKQQSSVSKSLHESNLAIFLQSLSKDYHRNWSTAHDVRNNGSRPLSLKDVDVRMRQRTVTLMGGGINASIPTSNRPKNAKQGIKKKRKRTSEQVDVSRNISTTTNNDFVFLTKLNRLWNDYVCEFFEYSMSSIRDPETTMQSIQQKLGACLKSGDMNYMFEIVGAHVKILSCNSHRSWQGRFGVVVAHTVNTLRVAVVPVKEKHSQTGKSEQSCSKIASIYADLLVVPKQGTSIMLLVPFPVMMSSKEECNDHLKHCEPQDSLLVPLCEQTVCVTLATII